MICGDCKRGNHIGCPEITRQGRIRRSPGRTPEEDRLRVLHVITGQVCDCAHENRVRVLRDIQLVSWGPDIRGFESLTAGNQ